MGDSFSLLNLILVAVAVGVFLKLRSVLGRRTGNERPPFDPYAAPDKPASAKDKVIALPKRPAPSSDAGHEEASFDPYPQREPYVVKDSWEATAPAGSPLAQKLTEISLADRHFDLEGFLSGARIAYEMIVDAFAKGDRAALRPLLDDDVYKSFEAVITVREQKGETVGQSFVGIDKAELVTASLEGQRARLAVRFASQLTSCVKNHDGVVIEGDPVTIRHVTDLWTFERDVKNSDPNWRLVATGTAG